MLRKFIDGLVFGGGFAIAFVGVWYLAAYLITPLFVASPFERAANKQPADMQGTFQSSELGRGEVFRELATPFHELGLDEKIKRSSVIALARYEPSPDGKMKAIITEFLKKDPNVTIHYSIGDEYPASSYYPKASTSYGDGVIIFFTGSPATMRMSMTYSGDRIHSLGDLPIELFRKKCEENA